MQIGGKIIPEVINDFNCYDNDGGKLIGVTGAVTLAPINMMTASISGAGIAGEYNTPIVGKTQSIQQEVPFRVLYADLAKFADSTTQTGVTIRGAIQVKDAETGLIDAVPMRYVIRGNAVTVNPGSVQVGNPMDGSVTWEVLYSLLEIGGKKVFELDKLNGVYSVNGKDVMSKIRKMC